MIMVGLWVSVVCVLRATSARAHGEKARGPRGKKDIYRHPAFSDRKQYRDQTWVSYVRETPSEGDDCVDTAVVDGHEVAVLHAGSATTARRTPSTMGFVEKRCL